MPFIFGLSHFARLLIMIRYISHVKKSVYRHRGTGQGNHVDSSATSVTVALRLPGLELSESSTSSMYAPCGWSVPEPFSFSFPLPLSEVFTFFPFFFLGRSHSYSGMKES